MKDKEKSFCWEEYNNRSCLYCGDKYIATVDYNNDKNWFLLSLRVEHSIYACHDLNAANLDEAKQKAVEMIAIEYEKVIAHARAKLEEYEGLATALTELQFAKGHNRDFRSLDDTINEAKALESAEKGTDKDKTKNKEQNELNL